MKTPKELRELREIRVKEEIEKRLNEINRTIEKRAVELGSLSYSLSRDELLSMEFVKYVNEEHFGDPKGYYYFSKEFTKYMQELKTAGYHVRVERFNVDIFW